MLYARGVKVCLKRNVQSAKKSTQPLTARKSIAAMLALKKPIRQNSQKTFWKLDVELMQMNQV
jgi:hypothetical protein